MNSFKESESKIKIVFFFRGGGLGALVSCFFF